MLDVCKEHQNCIVVWPVKTGEACPVCTQVKWLKEMIRELRVDLEENVGTGGVWVS